MSTYLNPNFLRLINKDIVNTIFECGSMDGIDTVELHDYFHNASIFAFEIADYNIITLHKRLDNVPNVFIIEKALSDNVGFVDFYQHDVHNSKDKNIGISSLLPIKYDRRSIGMANINEDEIIMNKKSISAVSVDYMSEQLNRKPDLLCLDAQGGELKILNGANETLRYIRYIITEVNYLPTYENMPIFDDINKFLAQRNFICEYKTNESFFGDAIFVNKGNDVL